MGSSLKNTLDHLEGLWSPKPYPQMVFGTRILTQRLLCSSFLVMTYFWLRDDYNILPKKELHSSLWVKIGYMDPLGNRSLDPQHPAAAEGLELLAKLLHRRLDGRKAGFVALSLRDPPTHPK